MFNSLAELSGTFDVVELREVAQYAAERELALDVALGQLNPYHFDSRTDLQMAGAGDVAVGLERVITRARELGCVDLMFTIGTVEDRYSRICPWTDQLQATVRLVQSLAPLLRDLGARLCLKTHEEITSFEVLRMIEQVGPELLSVCFDPVNVLVRIEDPLAAARRLLPFIRQVQLDDAVVAFAPSGLERWLYPLGGGIVDWPAILELLETQDVAQRYTIELHRAFFDMPIFDAAWLAGQPDLTPAELASVIRLAHASRGVTDGQAFQEAPESRLAPTLAYVREVIARSNCATT
jgi:sugar phosphate isomerase/epimerase